MNRYEFEQAVFKSNLDPNSRLILLYYAHRKNWKNDSHVWPSIETVAEATSLGRRTVARKVPMLRDLGWLRATGALKGNGKGRPSQVYDLDIGANVAPKVEVLSATETPKVEQEPETLVPLTTDFSATGADFSATESNFGATVAYEQGYNMTEQVNEEVIESPDPSGPVDQDIKSLVKEERAKLTEMNNECFNSVLSLTTKVSPEQELEALQLLTEKKMWGMSFRDKCINALTKVGAVVEKAS